MVAALLASAESDAAAAAATTQANEARLESEKALRAVTKLCDQYLPHGALPNGVPYDRRRPIPHKLPPTAGGTCKAVTDALRVTECG